MTTQTLFAAYIEARNQMEQLSHDYRLARSYRSRKKLAKKLEDRLGFSFDQADENLRTVTRLLKKV
jgi:hypothetical protein